VGTQLVWTMTTDDDDHEDLLSHCTHDLNPYQAINIDEIASNTLAARGLEEPRNFQELLTESVGPVHFF